MPLRQYQTKKTPALTNGVGDARGKSRAGKNLIEPNFMPPYHRDALPARPSVPKYPPFGWRYGGILRWLLDPG